MVRIIVDIDEETLRQVMVVLTSRSKQGAIMIALNEYLRLKKRQELSAMIGNYREFDFTRGDYRKMRYGR
jgi:hypothetical protein